MPHNLAVFDSRQRRSCMANPSTTHDDQDPKSSRSHISLRRRLRGTARQMFPGEEFFWAGGILYFSNKAHIKPERVPGIPEVPKPGREVMSLMEAGCPIKIKRQGKGGGRTGQWHQPTAQGTERFLALKHFYSRWEFFYFFDFFLKAKTNWQVKITVSY